MTRNDGRWLLHLAFLIHRDTSTGQKDVEALSPHVIGSGMSTCLGGNLVSSLSPLLDEVDTESFNIISKSLSLMSTDFF